MTKTIPMTSTNHHKKPPMIEPSNTSRSKARLATLVGNPDLRVELQKEFRPGKSPHHDLEYLREHCYQQQVCYILDVDVRKYFDTIDHGYLRDILRAWVKDGVISRLIYKWLKARVWEDGRTATRE